ncbi:MAG: hypothetical protein QW791_07835 [Candidatus Bathyarchaeia archaeon]
MSMSDISLWLAVTAIILLVTSELVSSASGSSGDVIVEKKRLRIVAIALGIGFMATVVVRIFYPF